MTEKQLGRETMEGFLHQASIILWRQEVRKSMCLVGRERHGETPTKQATWGHRVDPMKLDIMKITDRWKESNECFQCEKVRRIYCNCHFEGKEILSQA